MKWKGKISVAMAGMFCLFLISSRNGENQEAYKNLYIQKLDELVSAEERIINVISTADLTHEKDIVLVSKELNNARNAMKGADFWLRYLEPTIYKQINGPLPVEWETEVFEKYEKPYKREGAGLTLAALYLQEEHPQEDTLISLVRAALKATTAYKTDSIGGNLDTYHHFFLCNRLFLLNLSAIYTTGFECPDTSRIVPEIATMLSQVMEIYQAYDESFQEHRLSHEYIELYKKLQEFVKTWNSYSSFDHYTFIREYVNPLYAMNQAMIREYNVRSKSVVDYTLNRSCSSIFDKSIYTGQNAKGIYKYISDEEALDEISAIGKLLFYDPILSGNGQRSCASCHIPGHYFTDTTSATAYKYDRQGNLDRNTPSLINVGANHLVMQDGSHISLQNQTKAVVTNPVEMGGVEKEALTRVMSCKQYRKAFTSFLKYTPQETEVTFEHIASAITLYYDKFSKFESPFDQAMNKRKNLSADAVAGFNLFMGKAQSGTCHFVPQFNGVKPPYIGSEFEVLGVPNDTAYKTLSPDKGRYLVNPASETLSAFRTGSLRNIIYTAPYMHNGVFRTLNQVIDFYDAGGGAGKGLRVDNQTLSSDSLRLTAVEKQQLIIFLGTLTEQIKFEQAPDKLPSSSISAFNNRKVGGEY